MGEKKGVGVDAQEEKVNRGGGNAVAFGGGGFR